jgi:hypothetical protein
MVAVKGVASPNIALELVGWIRPPLAAVMLPV